MILTLFHLLIAIGIFELHASGYFEPIRFIKAVDPYAPIEEVVQLEKARVVYADYNLLRHDFPKLKVLTNQEIDRWLLNQVGFISSPHTKENEVNRVLSIADQKRQAYRPQGYNRALVYRAYSPHNTKEKIGLLDVKGTGLAPDMIPSRAPYGNGLMTLGEAIREYLYEKMINMILRHHGASITTVGSYAVIDPGFKLIHENSLESPAGLYVRQAHTRSKRYVG